MHGRFAIKFNSSEYLNNVVVSPDICIVIRLFAVSEIEEPMHKKRKECITSTPTVSSRTFPVILLWDIVCTNTKSVWGVIWIPLVIASTI